MFILFGWGHKKFNELGPVKPHLCTHCHNKSSWNLSKVTTYFEFFFVPVIPYSTKYCLYCPVCDKAISITQKHFEYLKNFTLLNNAFNQDQLTEEVYKEMILKLENASPDIIADKEDWDFDENKLTQAKSLEKDFSILKFLKFAVPIFLIFLFFYLL